jgi:fimbrial chaperone protein
MRRGPAQAGAVLLALLCGTGSAAAGGLAVSPVNLAFEPSRRATVMEVSNPTDQPTTVQVRVFRWLQDGGDRYEPTADIGFSPPIFALGPKERQVVRLVLRTSRPEKVEAAYRIFVDELPKPDEPGVQTPFRMVAPAFVVPKSPGRGELQWRIARAPSGEARLIAENVGAARVKLTNLAYVVDGQPQMIAPGLAGYVLAGRSGSWGFEPPAGASVLTVTAETERGPIAETLPLP